MIDQAAITMKTRSPAKSSANEQTAAARDAAIEAWSQLAPDCARMARLELLKQPRRATYFRLHGAGAGGSDVIALRCRSRRAARERAAYQNVLARLEVPSPRFYGSVAEEGGEWHWVFVEDAAGRPYRPERDGDRVLAGRWLANLHARAADVFGAAAEAGLPDGGPDRYLAELRAGLAALQNVREDRAIAALLPEGSDGVLHKVISQCMTASAHWDEVRQLCDSVPRTVVHGDFAPRNLRVGTTAGEPALRVFDWEDAAWAPPALDLIQADPRATCDAANPDVAEYLGVICRHWTNVNAETIRRLGEMGRLFWNLLAIRLDACSITPEWVHGPIANLQLYADGLAEVLAALDWGT